jgi:hypothetical protein
VRLELDPDARLEFLSASARYEAAVPGLGRRFVAEFEGGVSLLLESPGRGPLRLLLLGALAAGFRPLPVSVSGHPALSSESLAPSGPSTWSLDPRIGSWTQHSRSAIVPT